MGFTLLSVSVQTEATKLPERVNLTWAGTQD